MAKQHLRAALPWLPILLGACASTGSAKTTAPSPALPTQAPTLAAEFRPDAELKPLAIACQPEESASPNGVDDNCDGIIDDTPTAQHLSLALAYPQHESEAIRAWVAPEGSGRGEPNEPQDSPVASAAVQVRRLDVAALPKGRYEVLLTRRTYAGAEAALPISVSLATSGQARTYVVSLDAGETRSLGQIVVR